MNATYKTNQNLSNWSLGFSVHLISVEMFWLKCWDISLTNTVKRKPLSAFKSRKTETVNPLETVRSTFHSPHCRLCVVKLNLNTTCSLRCVDNIHAANRSSVSACWRLVSVETHRQAACCQTVSTRLWLDTHKNTKSWTQRDSSFSLLKVKHSSGNAYFHQLGNEL